MLRKSVQGGRLKCIRERGERPRQVRKYLWEVGVEDNMRAAQSVQGCLADQGGCV